MDITTRRGWLETFFLAISALILALSLQATDAHADGFRPETALYVDNVYFPAPQWIEKSVDRYGNIRYQPLGPADRQLTGKGNKLHFRSNESVFGWSIVLDDGRSFPNLCYLAVAPTGGWITDGVINPFKGEIEATQPCPDPVNPSQPIPAVQSPAPQVSQPAQQVQPSQPAQVDNTRVASGNGGRLDFVRGQAVMGGHMKLNNGTERNQCSFDAAPDNGYLLSGVRGTPYSGEKLPACAP